MLALVLASSAAQGETVQPGQRWNWAPTAGWLDASPLDENGPGLHLANGIVTGWLWSENLGWVSAHCSNTSSCGDVAYGLRLEPDPELPDFLQLAGQAWSENAGWIVVNCATTNSCDAVDYGLRVHRASGLVDGYAWGENIGWISFSCANTGSCQTTSFGLQFDPAAMDDPPDDLFSDGFES